MAIQTVTTQNLAEFAANRTQLGSQLATNEQVAEQAASSDTKGPTPGNPVITAGEERLADGTIDPGIPEKSEKPKKNPVQPRIDELTREKKEMEEFAESEYNLRLETERKVKELEAEVQRLKPVQEQPAELKRPVRAEYTDMDKYEEDLATFAAKKALQEREVQEAQKRQAEYQQAQQALLTERLEKARNDIPDYDEVVKNNDVDVPNYIQGAIMESKHGAVMAYLLAKDKALYKSLMAMPPAEALTELGIAAYDFLHPRGDDGKFVEKVDKPVSKAPAPIASLKADSGIVPTDLSKPMSFAEYKTKRREELRRKRH